MIPLITRRSSTRCAPRRPRGISGSIRAHSASESQYSALIQASAVWKLDGVDGPRPDGMRCARVATVNRTPRAGAVPMQIITVGLDIAKNVFQVHGVDSDGRAVLRRKVRREQLVKLFGG